jgi:hypothetical protein
MEDTMHPITQFAGGAATALAVCAVGASAGALIPSDAPTQRVLVQPAASVTLPARWTRRSVLDLSTGRRVVVSPCTFRNMWMNGNADLSRASDRRRGDWWAIHHGCEPQPGQSLYVHSTGLTEVR